MQVKSATSRLDHFLLPSGSRAGLLHFRINLLIINIFIAIFHSNRHLILFNLLDLHNVLLTTPLWIIILLWRYRIFLYQLRSLSLWFFIIRGDFELFIETITIFVAVIALAWICSTPTLRSELFLIVVVVVAILITRLNNPSWTDTLWLLLCWISN